MPIIQFGPAKFKIASKHLAARGRLGARSPELLDRSVWCGS